MSKIDTAVKWMCEIAADNSHGYSQEQRWGPDYDCSSLIISAYERAGVPVKTNGATYTGNMKSVFIKCGFKDVTALINLATGEGLKRGDVLLNEASHTALVVTDGGGTIVHASINEKGTVRGGKIGDQTGKEICTRSYYNKPWNCILRFVGEDTTITISNYNATGIVNVSDVLNVRNEPNIVSAKIGEFNNGDLVTITGKCSNGWYRCSIYDDGIGYICGDYVSNVTETVSKSKKQESTASPMIYNYMDENMPEWAKPTIQKLLDKHILLGDGEGKLGLTMEMLKNFVVNDRAGLYD